LLAASWYERGLDGAVALSSLLLGSKRWIRLVA
jgi:hypothetical protein